MNKINFLKATATAATAAIAGVFKVVALPFAVLCIVMAADYCTGIIKSKQAGALSSRTGLKGIIKKLSYGAAVIAAAGVDYTICYVGAAFGEQLDFKGLFVLLTIFWLIANECISILENLSAIGVPFPAFLTAVAKKLKSDIEKKEE